MIRLKALLQLTISPLLFLANLMFAFQITHNSWVVAIMMGILINRHEQMRSSLYSNRDHWILALATSIVIFLYPKTYDFPSLIQCLILTTMIVIMFQHANAPRLRLYRLLWRLRAFPKSVCWEITSGMIKVHTETSVSVIETGGLRSQEMKWISHHLVLWDRKLTTHTLRVILDEQLGQCETRILGR